MSAEGAAEVGTVEGVGVDSIAFVFAKRKASLQSKVQTKAQCFVVEIASLVTFLGFDRAILLLLLLPLLVQQQQWQGAGGRACPSTPHYSGEGGGAGKEDSNLLLLLL